VSRKNHQNHGGDAEHSEADSIGSIQAYISIACVQKAILPAYFQQDEACSSRNSEDDARKIRAVVLESRREKKIAPYTQQNNAYYSKPPYSMSRRLYCRG
jgi:hypothetical protein